MLGCTQSIVGRRAAYVCAATTRGGLLAGRQIAGMWISSSARFCTDFAVRCHAGTAKGEGGENERTPTDKRRGRTPRHRQPRHRHCDFSRVFPTTCMRYCRHRTRAQGCQELCTSQDLSPRRGRAGCRGTTPPMLCFAGGQPLPCYACSARILTSSLLTSLCACTIVARVCKGLQ